MSILIDSDRIRLLEKACRRPNLCFLPFSPSELLSTIHDELFPDVRYRIRHCFVDRGPLACITATNDGYAIYTHQLLNHPDTPRELMSMIVKHELLHLRVPSVLQDGVWESHPLQFWQAEAELCPERKAVWVWIWSNFGGCLRRRRREQCIEVKGDWKKIWNQSKLGFAACARLAEIQRRGYPKYGDW